MNMDYSNKGVPTAEEAIIILKEAEKLNSGGWVKHSMYVAESAKLIAEQADDLVARTCLSHIGFKYNNEVVIVGKWDGTTEELSFVKKYLSCTEETDYDKLIKLCDYLSLPSGFVLIEKRLVEMALRGGVNEYTIPRWKSTFEIKQYFEQKIGKSIYSLLPNVIENTFDK